MDCDLQLSADGSQTLWSLVYGAVAAGWMVVDDIHEKPIANLI